LAVELAMATLVWVPRLRGLLLLLAVGLHLGIEYAMNIPLFSFLMIASYITFLPSVRLAPVALFTSRVWSRMSRAHGGALVGQGLLASPIDRMCVRLGQYTAP
jgi:hypothetical protein